jgi:hypothetical protein
VRISENLREGMFDQAYFGQYGKFQEGIGGILGRMGGLTGRSWDCGESIVLLITNAAPLNTRWIDKSQ